MCVYIYMFIPQTCTHAHTHTCTHTHITPPTHTNTHAHTHRHADTHAVSAHAVSVQATLSHTIPTVWLSHVGKHVRS